MKGDLPAGLFRILSGYFHYPLLFPLRYGIPELEWGTMLGSQAFIAKLLIALIPLVKCGAADIDLPESATYTEARLFNHADNLHFF